MSILETLAGMIPRRHQTIRNDALGKLITRDRAEIEAAREQGYSWRQIGQAAKAAWGESGEWHDTWNSELISARYQRLIRSS